MSSHACVLMTVLKLRSRVCLWLQVWPSANRTVFLAEASELMGQAEALSALPASSFGASAASQTQVVYRFGYCASVDCGERATGSLPPRVWLSGWQTDRLFEYTSPLLPFGEQQGDGSFARTLVVCAADAFKGTTVRLSEVCVTQTVSTAPAEQEPSAPSWPSCFSCLPENFREDDGALPPILPSYNCLVSAARCVAAAAGNHEDEAAVEGLLDALLLVQRFLDTDTSPVLQRGILSLSVEVILAISKAQPSLSVVANAVSALRWASLRFDDMAASNPEAVRMQANTVLNIVGSLQERYKALRSALQEEPNYLPTGDCAFTANSQDLQQAAAQAVLKTLHPGARPLLMSGPYSSQLLGMVDTFGVTEDMTFQLPPLLDSNGTTESGAPQRHRRLLQMDAQDTPPAPSSGLLPQVALPRTLATACNQAPVICPQPVVLKLSYIHDSTFLLQSMGRGTWAAAAARYADLSLHGLRVDVISGQMSVELVSVAKPGLALLGSWVTLQFPVDQQITGATLSSGKLCARIDYDRLVPEITGEPTIVNGTASCFAEAEGDYVVIQMSYRVAADPGGRYVSIARDVPPIYETVAHQPSRYLFSRSNMARFEVAVAVMVLLSLVLVAVMFLRCIKTLHEDPFADETLPGAQSDLQFAGKQSLSEMRRRLTRASSFYMWSPTTSQKYLTVAYEDDSETPEPRSPVHASGTVNANELSHKLRHLEELSPPTRPSSIRLMFQRISRTLTGGIAAHALDDGSTASGESDLLVASASGICSSGMSDESVAPLNARRAVTLPAPGELRAAGISPAAPEAARPKHGSFRLRGILKATSFVRPGKLTGSVSSRRSGLLPRCPPHTPRSPSFEHLMSFPHT